MPEEKMADFGVHADKYYALEVSLYKNKADEEMLAQLWEQYWVATLSQTMLQGKASRDTYE